MLAFTREQIVELCNALQRHAACSEVREHEGTVFRFVDGDKTLEFLWRDDAREELWVALFEKGECVFTMFEESWTLEGQLAVFRHFELVVARFFGTKTRIAKKYWLFGSKSLQFHDGASWREIYELAP